MKRGYRRDGKGVAVLRFLIGIVLLGLLGFLVYYEYSNGPLSVKAPDLLQNEEPPVSVSAPTQAPQAEGAGDEAVKPADAQQDAVPTLPPLVEAEPAGAVQTTQPVTPAPEATVEVIELAAAEPTAQEPAVTPAAQEPTVAPLPTKEPAPTATPAPTAVPKELLATAKTKGFKIPESSGKLVSGITGMETVAANNYGVLHISGFSFINDAKFKGSDFETYVVAKRENTGKLYAYQAKPAPGVSGAQHEDCVVAEVRNADFEVYFDVKKMESAIYHVSIVTGYKNEKGKTVYDYNDLGDEIWFTIMNGEVIKLPEQF